MRKFLIKLFHLDTELMEETAITGRLLGKISKNEETIAALQAEHIRLLGILYRPNEEIVNIRDPLLEAMKACQPKPIITIDDKGEAEITGTEPPSIPDALKAIEKALEACQKAIAAQRKGVDGPGTP